MRRGTRWKKKGDNEEKKVRRNQRGRSEEKRKL